MSATLTAVRRFRWTVCALLFAATTLNYVDRQVLGVLAPELERLYGWSELEYSHIVTAFQAAYALGLLCAGAVIDRLGTRLGYALAIAVWSLAAMSHALATTVTQFATARFALGLGESGNFPAAMKSVAEWFAPEERALATGIFNAGTNAGVVIALLAVPVVVALFGLRAAFLFTGVLSAVWLSAWLLLYRAPASAAAPAAGLKWRELLRHRQAWVVVTAKLLTDPIWWFCLFWLPKYLHSTLGLSLGERGLPLIVIYLLADVGSIGGGWIAKALMRRGLTLNRSRKTAMLACALAVAPIVLVPRVHGLWSAVALIGLATAGHQGWSANVYSIAADLFPSHAVARVVGLGGFAGAASGALISTVIGLALQATGSYAVVFLMASSAYLIAFAAVQALTPHLTPVSA